MDAANDSPLLYTYRLSWARRSNLLRMLSHNSDYAEFEIQALAVWARYLSVHIHPHNTESSQVSGEETFASYQPGCPSGDAPAWLPNIYLPLNNIISGIHAIVQIPAICFLCQN